MSVHARTAAALLLLLAAFAALAALLMPSPPAQAAQERPAAAVHALTAAAPADPLLAVLAGPAGELPPNVAELLLAADRVCDGITSQVPLSAMIDALTAEPLPGATSPLSPEEAALLVNTAAATHCGAPAV